MADYRPPFCRAQECSGNVWRSLCFALVWLLICPPCSADCDGPWKTWRGFKSLSWRINVWWTKDVLGGKTFDASELVRSAPESLPCTCTRMGYWWDLWSAVVTVLLFCLCQMQQQELAQMRQRDANLTALAAIGPRKKRKVDSPGATSSGTEVRSGYASVYSVILLSIKSAGGIESISAISAEIFDKKKWISL